MPEKGNNFHREQMSKIAFGSDVLLTDGKSSVDLLYSGEVVGNIITDSAGDIKDVIIRSKNDSVTEEEVKQAYALKITKNL